MLITIGSYLIPLRDYFHSPKGAANTVFLLGGGIALWCLIPQAIHDESPKPDPRINLYIGIATTCLIVGLVEVLQEVLKIFREDRDLPRFHEFFGSEVTRSEGLPVVFLGAEPPRDETGAVTLKITHPPARAGKTKPKGCKNLAIFEDLQAALAIEREFRKHRSKIQLQLDIYHSAETELPPTGCISVGLGYNNVTARLAEHCPDLFVITYDDKSDDFYLGVDKQHGNDVQCEDYALIARVVLGSAKRPVPYIICAGHSAEATFVAGEYIAKHWRLLAQLYKHSDNPKRLNESNMAVILRYNKDAVGKPTAPFLGQPLFTHIGQHRKPAAGSTAKQA
ncbi:MAG: hypothetical protein ACRC8S_13260 [Fimbriiglobus sp.]